MKIENRGEQMENKHLKEALAQFQSLDLDSKVILTKARIKAWYEYFGGKVYVSFSGGKDSTVLLHLVRSLYSDVEAVFCDTGLEFPEIRDFVKNFENVTWLKPKMNFKDVLIKYGYPIISKEVAQEVEEARNTKSEKLRDKRLFGVNGSGKIPEKWKFLLHAPFNISSKCCSIMKKNPAKKYEKETGKKAMIGTLACESRLRKQAWIRHGCNAFEAKRPTSQPLSFWTEQDILQYIYINKLSIASVYGKIIVEQNGTLKTTQMQRTGCAFCGFGLFFEKPNKFSIMKKTHPQIYRFVMKPLEEGGLGFQKVLNFLAEGTNEK